MFDAVFERSVLRQCGTANAIAQVNTKHTAKYKQFRIQQLIHREHRVSAELIRARGWRKRLTKGHACYAR